MSGGIKMYVLQRIIYHSIKTSNTWEEHLVKKDLTLFYLTDEEFNFLQELPKEYKYHEFDNEFYIDRHPSILEEGIDNKEFIEDYKNHLTDKFFVAYTYYQLEADKNV